MTLYLKDHMGPLVLKNVTKIEWVTKEWYGGETETRIVIYNEDGLLSNRHLDDLVKIEN